MHKHTPDPSMNTEQAIEELRRHTWYIGMDGSAFARIPTRTNLMIDQPCPAELALKTLGISAIVSSGRRNTLLIEIDASRLGQYGIEVTKDSGLPSSRHGDGMSR